MSRRKVKIPPASPEIENESSEENADGSEEPIGFSGNGRAIPQSLAEEDLKSKREKEREAAQKEELLSEIGYIFEEHAKLCTDIESSLKNMDVIIRRMGALRQRMLEEPVAPLHLTRRLHFDALFNDMRVASQRVNRVRNLSFHLNMARRSTTLQETSSDKVSFE